VDFDPLWQIAFSGPNSVNGKSVIDTLDKIYTYIDTRVFGLLGRFLSRLFPSLRTIDRQRQTVNVRR
jgi:hypothetical protein